MKRLQERGYLAYFASELEFYLIDESYASARAKHWQNLDTASPYIEDYVIQLTTKEEAIMVLCFAKALGEFGATITFVSNIPGETQTISAAIYSFM